MRATCRPDISSTAWPGHCGRSPSTSDGARWPGLRACPGAGSPTRLFEGPYFLAAAAAGRTYDVSPDGQRFLMIKVGAGSDQTAAPTNIVVVQTWHEELKRLVPTN